MNSEYTTIEGSEKTISLDYRYLTFEKEKLFPVVMLHGFKGYKDWGCNNMVADSLARAGFFVLKLNFSFNGTTAQNLREFADLDAFKNNNFSRELDDLNRTISWVFEKFGHQLHNGVSLLAHSRGGATALIAASKDDRIEKVVTWASVGTIRHRFPQIDLVEYKRTGVMYIPNARTGQQMPLGYQIVSDYFENEEDYELESITAKVSQPVLMFHGTVDPTVPLSEAKALQSRIPGAGLIIIEGGDHNFGAVEPWTEDQMPEDLSAVVKATIKFLRS